MSDSARTTGPALEAHFQFLLWLAPTVDRPEEMSRLMLKSKNRRCWHECQASFAI